MKKIVILSLICCGLWSCVEEASPSDPLVIQRLEEKKKAFIADILERCRQDAISRAEMYVDSLLSEQIQISVNDTVHFPLKPERPDIVPIQKDGKFITPEPIFLDTVLGGK